MGDPNTLRFESPSAGGGLSLDELVEAIVSYMREVPGRSYRVSIGSDSPAQESAAITTAIVVRRVGNGARYFHTRTPVQRYETLRDRIFAEAMQAILLGQELRSRLTDRLGEVDIDDIIEIHVDAGENGPTKDFLAAIRGMLEGFQFNPVTKPLAYAASAVADRHAG